MGVFYPVGAQETVRITRKYNILSQDDVYISRKEKSVLPLPESKEGGSQWGQWNKEEQQMGTGACFLPTQSQSHPSVTLFPQVDTTSKTDSAVAAASGVKHLVSRDLLKT